MAYRITWLDGQKPRDVAADSYKQEGEFIEFWSEKVGQVLTIRAKDVKAIERVNE